MKSRPAFCGRALSTCRLRTPPFSALRSAAPSAPPAPSPGAIAAGLSGTGPSFVAIADDNTSPLIMDAWKSYPGKVISTKVDNQGTKVINI